MRFAALLGIDRMGPLQWAGVVAAVLGVAVVVSDKLVAGRAPSSLGDLLVVLAAGCFAAYSLASRPLVARYGPTVASAGTLLALLLVLAPIGWGRFAAQDLDAVGLPAWAALVFASLLPLELAFLLWTWAIARRGVGRTTPYLFLLPMLTGAFSALLTGETIGPTKIAGAVLILAGTAVVRVVGGRMSARTGIRDPAPEPGRGAPRWDFADDAGLPNARGCGRRAR